MGRPKTRANGEGTIYKTKYGTYVAQITVNGDRASETFKTQRKAQAWLTEQKRLRDTNQYVEPSEKPVGVWIDYFITTYRSKVSDATKATYKYSLARLPQDLLEMEIGKVTEPDIQRALNGIHGSHRTVEMTRTLLNMAFEKAKTLKMISDNVVKGTVFEPDNTPQKAKALTREEETKLVEVLTRPTRRSANGTVDKFDLASQTIRDALFLCLRTSATREEAVSIKWSDVGDELRIPGTKNSTRDRTVPVPDDLRDMLNRRRFNKNSEYVFASRSGKKLHGSALLKWMRNNTNHTVHDLRHTYITRGAQAGVNPKVLMKLTGHKSLETLLKVYTHVQESDLEDATAKITSYCKATASII